MFRDEVCRMQDLAHVESALRSQAQACDVMGSPLYGFILDRLARGDDGGGVLKLLATRPADEDVIASAIVLRMMASIHQLALTNNAPSLAAHYPSCGGDGDAAEAWVAFIETFAKHKETITRDLGVPVQTNEVGRAAALLGGFLLVAERYGLPLRLLEVGASAGLMLQWDRFRYETKQWSWGPADSRVRLIDQLAYRMPFSPDVRVNICERAGCDVAPIDPATEFGKRRLLSFVWPDQRERLTRLAAACDVARKYPVVIDRAHAWPWLAKQLAATRSGVVTVVFHTVMQQYLDSSERIGLSETIAEAGKRATLDAPLAYLTLEPQPRRAANVVLRLWPGNCELELASASLHGSNVEWLYVL